MIIDKLYALNIGKIGFRYHIWQFYLVNNLRKNHNFHWWKLVNTNWCFSYWEGSTWYAQPWIWAELARTGSIGHQMLDFLVIHKVKWPKNVLIWWKLKNSYFSHISRLQWPVMDKLKPMIYFQTKSDFLDNFLLSGLLCRV